jgi:hypothetical protein
MSWFLLTEAMTISFALSMLANLATAFPNLSPLNLLLLAAVACCAEHELEQRKRGAHLGK